MGWGWRWIGEEERRGEMNGGEEREGGKQGWKEGGDQWREKEEWRRER